MISEPQYPQKMTAEQYLEWEAKQELRYEYMKKCGFIMLIWMERLSP